MAAPVAMFDNSSGGLPPQLELYAFALDSNGSPFTWCVRAYGLPQQVTLGSSTQLELSSASVSGVRAAVEVDGTWWVLAAL